MKALFTVFAFALIGLLAVPNQAQAQDETYKGALIYQFTRYISWGSFGNQFDIEVVGSSAVTPVLKEISVKKKVDDKAINVKQVEAGSTGSPQIIFIPANQKDQLAAVLAKVGSKPILVITESAGSAEQGAGINFVKQGDKVQFELNKTVLKKLGISPDLNLERLASKVL